MLDQLAQLGRELCTAAFRTAVGFPAIRGQEEIVRYLESKTVATCPVQIGSTELFLPIDFSVASAMFRSEPSIVNPEP